MREPQPIAQPYLWRWADVERLMIESRDFIGIDEAERRGLFLANPGLGGKPYMTNTLLSDLQLLRPGETAPTHRHTSSSSRFHMTGKGAYTTVEGEKCPMEPGDVIINPSWAWHDHGNDGREDVIYWNVLDVPLVEHLDNIFYDFEYVEAGDARPDVQSVKKTLGYSEHLYSAPAVAPNFVAKSGKPYSAKLIYRWKETQKLLNRLRSYQGSVYDGIIVEYVHSETGGPVLPTMSFHMQLLRPGERLLSHRHTSSTVYCVVEGEGYTEVDGKRLEWDKYDFFAIPSWFWHEHVNLRADQEAILFSVSDLPTIRKLGLYREQGRTPLGEVVMVAEP